MSDSVVVDLGYTPMLEDLLVRCPVCGMTMYWDDGKFWCGDARCGLIVDFSMAKLTRHQAADIVIGWGRKEWYEKP